MTDKEREKFEDLVVAILLSKTKILKKTSGRSLRFELEERKISIFQDYIQRYHLSSQIEFNESKFVGAILPSIMLENILRTWVLEDRVRSINPLALRANTYYLWISLFGEKNENSVSIQTDLDPDIQHTLTYLFNQQFGVSLYRGNRMQIMPFSPIMLQAIKSNRPIEESMELSYLLPNKEKAKIKAAVTEWEEERANYAF
jgi:hypothetical protein